MTIPYTKRESKYLGIALLILLLGLVGCVVAKDASWMAGVGALIIVVGVYFASKNFGELFASSLTKVSILATAFGFIGAVNEKEEELKRDLSPAEKEELYRQLAEGQASQLKKRLKETNQRLRFVEAHIVILGTLVNGWGQLLLDPLVK